MRFALLIVAIVAAMGGVLFAANTQIGGSSLQIGSIQLDGTPIAKGPMDCRFTKVSGPAGAALDIQGWIKVTVDGQVRYIPYW